MNEYRDLYQASRTDPTAFWAQAAREVTWIPRSTGGFPMLNSTRAPTRWTATSMRAAAIRQQ
jgi:Acetyl-coenzyme A synthetase N-terminus